MAAPQSSDVVHVTKPKFARTAAGSAGTLRWRRLTWLVHSWMGLITGSFLLAIGVSGSILVFYDEVGAFLQPALFRTSTGASLPVDSLYRLARARHDSMSMSMLVLPNHGKPAQAYFHRGHQSMEIRIDPVTGAELGVQTGGTLINKIRVFHWSFLVEPLGGTVATIAAAVLVLSSVSGLVVLRKVWGPFTRAIRWRSGVRTLMGDWHRLVGVLALVLNVFWGVSGVWMNRGFLSTDILETSDEGPAPMPPALTISLADALARSRAALPGFEPAGIEFPWDASATMTVYGAVHGQPLLLPEFGNSVLLHVPDFTIESVHDGRQSSVAEWWDHLAFTLHAGRFAGPIVRWLYVVLGLTPGVLAVTGAVIWFKRGRRWLGAADRAHDRTSLRSPRLAD